MRRALRNGRAKPAGTGRRPPQEPASTHVVLSLQRRKGDGATSAALAGADAYCQTLATAPGRGAATWHAYMSTQGAGAVNARDASATVRGSRPRRACPR